MNTQRTIGFNWPFMTGKELYYIAKAHFGGKLAGDGPFTKKCHEWLEKALHCRRALLTHSCTGALEMAALLLDIKPGDEVIMPSFTFVSTANAFVLRGATPVFVDIRPDTLNLNETKIKDAITEKTRAIVPVHYGGIACEMDAILSIARDHGLYVVEDAAQGIMSKYKGKPLGTIGDLGALSFHETKNIIAGEGGAILINRDEFVERAEIIREKGTDRSRFFRGEVDKYTWQEVGSSYLPGELIAAFLWAQLEDAENIIGMRLALWKEYDRGLREISLEEDIQLPFIPVRSDHNGHLYFFLLPDLVSRSRVLERMKADGVHAIFHYVPLHSSPAGKLYGRVSGEMTVTESISQRLIRLPLWVGLTSQEVQKVVFALKKAIRKS